MSELTNLVRDHVEAFDDITQEWQTAHGVRTVKLTVPRPVKWVERVRNRGILSALDFLSIIYFALNDWNSSPTSEMEARLVEGWATELRDAATDGQIKPRDVFTLLPFKSLPAGWDWGLSVDEANDFLKNRDLGWTCTEVVDHIYEQVAEDICEMKVPRFLNAEDATPSSQAGSSNEVAITVTHSDALAPLLPVQQSIAQEVAIRKAIEALGHNPRALPVAAPGHAGVKAEIKRALVVPPLFVSQKAFDRAWQRMRDNGDIADAS